MLDNVVYRFDLAIGQRVIWVKKCLLIFSPSKKDNSLAFSNCMTLFIKIEYRIQNLQMMDFQIKS